MCNNLCALWDWSCLHRCFTTMIITLSCLFFYPRLKPLDIAFMKAAHYKVNIVPVIAKADTLTKIEVQKLKKKVLSCACVWRTLLSYNYFFLPLKVFIFLTAWFYTIASTRFDCPDTILCWIASHLSSYCTFLFDWWRMIYPGPIFEVVILLGQPVSITGGNCYC